MTKEVLLEILKDRFNSNMKRHVDFTWEQIKEKILSEDRYLKVLMKMEETGGEPDLLTESGQNTELFFYDFSPESPEGRRNTCYDQDGEDMRTKKGVFPSGNAIEMAKLIGIELLTEEDYKKLQRIEDVDLKTSSWVRTPDSIREKGGAIFADNRFGHIFIYHNTAQSFYGSRGFRGKLLIK